MLPTQFLFFSPSERKCSALLKFQSSLSVVPSQRRRSPSQLYQLLTYATVGNNEFFFFYAVFHCSSVAPSFKQPVKFLCPKHLFLLSLYLSIWLKSDFRSHLDSSSSLALLLKGALSGNLLHLSEICRQSWYWPLRLMSTGLKMSGRSRKGSKASYVPSGFDPPCVL